MSPIESQTPIKGSFSLSRKPSSIIWKINEFLKWNYLLFSGLYSGIVIDIFNIMLKIKSIRNIICTSFLLLIVIHAVDGSVYNYFEGIDKASLNRQVKMYVINYIQQNKGNLCSIKSRSALPFCIIDSVFRHYKLPTQLRYLAVVESELKTKAVSRVGAVGLWQLMPETGRILGLKITARRDERKNDLKSTRAAAMHLRYLHKQFGDWLLAIAAYNCGEVPVQAAILQSGSRNFWKLQSHLPTETKDYVKKIIASCYFFEGRVPNHF